MTGAPQPEPQGSADPVPLSRAELDFLADARSHGGTGRRPRHSAFVKAMKRVLPALAALLLGAMLLWPQIQAERNRFQLKISGIDPRFPDRLRMINARFQGIDDDNQPYTVTTESAHEIKPDSRIYALESPAADLALKDGTWAMLRAPEGTFDRNVDVLKLQGGVSGFHDTGYEFTTSAARVLLREGKAEGDDPAFGHGPAGEIEGAQGFVATDKGRRILFKGKARLLIRPGVSSHGQP